MIDAVLGLGIKPVKTYPNGGHRETTITGFDDILAKEVLEEKEKSTEAKAAKADDGDYAYKDPVTGRAVVYVDVADASGKAGGTKAAEADSMKKTKYDEYFKEAAAKYNVSESLLKAMAKAESNFNADAKSSAGAMGVMQLMPATAQSLGVDDPFDPRQNIMGGAKCISQKLKEFNGNVRLSLAAYNAGSGAVKRYGAVPSYCRSYVNKVLSYKDAFEAADAVA